MFMPMKTTTLQCALEKMPTETVRQAAEMLKMLAHPDRLRIVDALNTAGELPVGEITAYLGIAQSATSQHLNHMRRIGLLKTERRGKEVWYSIADERPIALLNCICACCANNH
jgi:DNA-binding transcriptional ArsR family regulator